MVARCLVLFEREFSPLDSAGEAGEFVALGLSTGYQPYTRTGKTRGGNITDLSRVHRCILAFTSIGRGIAGFILRLAEV